MNQEKVNHYFERLDESLKSVGLPTSTGATRMARAWEFMLMRESDQYIHFKHKGQRNYLYMDKLTGKITIPVGGPFFLGEFDY